MQCFEWGFIAIYAVSRGVPEFYCMIEGIRPEFLGEIRVV